MLEEIRQHPRDDDAPTNEPGQKPGEDEAVVGLARGVVSDDEGPGFMA